MNFFCVFSDFPCDFLDFFFGIFFLEFSHQLRIFQNFKILFQNAQFQLKAKYSPLTADRLQHYVTAGLLPTDDLRNHLDRLKQAGKIYLKLITGDPPLVRFFGPCDTALSGEPH